MKWIIWLVATWLGASGLALAKPVVVSANAIITDWTTQIGGDQIEVRTLAGPGEDPHHFDPSPRQARDIRRASLIIVFGSGMEPWLADLLPGTSPPEILSLTDSAELMPVGHAYWEQRPMLYPDAEQKPPCCREDAIQANADWQMMIQAIEKDIPSAQVGHHHDHDCIALGHGEYDPHVWLEPQQALMMILAISEALEQLVPEHARTFQKRTENYLEQIIAVDEWAEAQLSTIPAENRILVNHHDNLRYFGRRYGFITPVSILGATTTEAHDPSARDFVTLIKFLGRHKVPALFYDSTANSRLAAQAAREAGLPPPTPLYTGNLTDSNGPAPDYLSLVRTNVESVTRALAPPPTDS